MARRSKDVTKFVLTPETPYECGGSLLQTISLYIYTDGACTTRRGDRVSQLRIGVGQRG